MRIRIRMSHDKENRKIRIRISVTRRIEKRIRISVTRRIEK